MKKEKILTQLKKPQQKTSKQKSIVVLTKGNGIIVSDTASLDVYIDNIKAEDWFDLTFFSEDWCFKVIYKDKKFFHPINGEIAISYNIEFLNHYKVKNAILSIVNKINSYKVSYRKSISDLLEEEAKTSLRL